MSKAQTLIKCIKKARKEEHIPICLEKDESDSIGKEYANKEEQIEAKQDIVEEKQYLVTREQEEIKQDIVEEKEELVCKEETKNQVLEDVEKREDLVTKEETKSLYIKEDGILTNNEEIKECTIEKEGSNEDKTESIIESVDSKLDRENVTEEKIDEICDVDDKDKQIVKILQGEKVQQKDNQQTKKVATVKETVKKDSINEDILSKDKIKSIIINRDNKEKQITNNQEVVEDESKEEISQLSKTNLASEKIIEPNKIIQDGGVDSEKADETEEFKSEENPEEYILSNILQDEDERNPDIEEKTLERNLLIKELIEHNIVVNGYEDIKKSKFDFRFSREQSKSKELEDLVIEGDDEDNINTSNTDKKKGFFSRFMRRKK